MQSVLKADDLCRLLADYRPVLRGTEADRALLAVLPLAAAPAPKWRDTLYLAASPEELARLPDGFCAVCCFPEQDRGTETDGRSLIFLDACPPPDAVLARLEDAISDHRLLARFSQALLALLCRDSSIQELVDTACAYLENSVVVFNAGYQLVACGHLPDHPNPSVVRWIEERYLSANDLIKMNFEHIHERVRKSADPILVQNRQFPGDKIISVISRQRDLGHFVIDACARPLRPIDYQCAAVLRDALAQQMQKDEFARNAQGFNYEYFLRDLLEGRFIGGTGSRGPIDYLDKKFSAPLCCLVVETARTPGAVSVDLLRNGFVQLFAGISAIAYQGQVLVIVSGQELHRPDSADLRTLRRFCDQHGLFCGMSNTFDHILNLPGYYQQALRAIELGADGGAGLFVYQDYYMKHLCSIFLQKEDAGTFCCSQMKRLIAYDQAHGKELAETLYQYLLRGSTAATAAAMSIHRNTLLYRLNLINQLVAIDYQDPFLCQYLIVSYEMAKAAPGTQ